MSKPVVHVLVPGSSSAACGVISVYNNNSVKSAITCKNCKKTEIYKSLPNGWREK
jgi:predicted nucleic-acid-binding Zn-ribbon protein